MLLKNSFYSLGGKVVNMILNIGSMAMLARLLTPKEFGIFAVIMALQAFFQPILDMGLGPVYIKKEEITEDFKNSFFTINLFLGCLNIIYLIIIGLFIHYFVNGVLFEYIFIFSLSIFFTSLTLIYNFHLTRELKFKELFYFNLISNISSISMAIVVAYFGYGIWALIFKALTMSLVMFLLVYFYTKIKFKVVSLEVIKQYLEDLKFGASIFINRIINGLFQSFDKLIIAKFYNTYLLGNYNNAKNLAIMSDSVIRTSLSGVVFSYMEKHNKTDYLKYYGIIFLISSLLPLLLFLWGDKVILLWLGEQWVEASKIIRPLSIFAIGMILKGIITMIAMHNKNMKTLNIWNVLVGFCFLLILLILSFFRYNLINTLYIISMFFTLSWVLFFVKINIKNGEDYE